MSKHFFLISVFFLVNRLREFSTDRRFMERSLCPRREDIVQDRTVKRSILSEEENIQLKKILNIFKTPVITNKEVFETTVNEKVRNLTSTKANETKLETKEEID